MINILEKIDSAKHIEIVVDSAFIPSASALYSHVLRLHKKVSFVCQSENINNNLSYLAWFDKIKPNRVISSDCTILFNYDALEFYNFFKDSNIKINSKMATALYSGILLDTDGFLNSKVDGTVFAVITELIEYGAEYKVANTSIMKSITLSSIRLKAIMFKSMILQNSAKTAVFFLNSDDLKSTGATLQDCDEVLQESLKLPHVEFAVLLDVDKEYESLKLIYKEI